MSESRGWLPVTLTRPLPTAEVSGFRRKVDLYTPDYYLLGDLLTQEQQRLRRNVRGFMDQEVIPVINQQAAPDHALLLSSTSGIRAADIAQALRQPGRLVIR
ncbi:MAG: hypothetical protein HOY76_36865 [Streptomyces sp.]|nr:hypothetical protein [Streptomyces sp.]